jgi:hypothetical protein
VVGAQLAAGVRACEVAELLSHSFRFLPVCDGP